MGRWVETRTYWHGDLLELERRPFTGWCAEETRERDGTVEVIRIVSSETQSLPHPEPELELLRIFALSALVHATFLVMVALTPKPPTRLVVEETVRDQELRAGILAIGSSGGDDWAGTRTRVAPIAIAAVPGPTRIVIPTPPGSRVRKDEPDLLIARIAPREAEAYGIIGLLGTIEGNSIPVSSLFGDSYVDGASGIGLSGIGEGGVEGGVVGGVIVGRSEDSLGNIGTIGIGSLGYVDHPRCAPLVDHLIERVFKDEKQRAFVRRTCRRASTRALDCLEQALSAERISALGIVARCGDDLPPALTARLRALQ